MAVKLAQEWFAICGGCEVTILDVGVPLLELLQNIEIVHMPVLMDHKIYGQKGGKSDIDIPEADVGIITGGIRNEEHIELAKKMREKSKTLIAMGSCACFGGIPALANMYTVDEIYNKVYKETKTTDPGEPPTQDIPPLTDRIYAIDEYVDVDIYLPGCPTSPDLVADALTALLEGKPFELPERSVCDDCPTRREKKAEISLRRPLQQIVPSGQKLEETRCFMEQGFLCLGPVTRSGCGGHEKTPRCIKAHMPCRGCFGPVRKGMNPMVEMMSALSSIGLDAREIPDRRATFNRYTGAHGRLRPLPKR